MNFLEKIDPLLTLIKWTPEDSSETSIWLVLKTSFSKAPKIEYTLIDVNKRKTVKNNPKVDER